MRAEAAGTVSHIGATAFRGNGDTLVAVVVAVGACLGGRVARVVAVVVGQE